MANKDLPFGFRALTNQAGTTPQAHEYTSASSVTIYEGGVMMVNTTGQVSLWDGTGTTYQRLLGVSAHGVKKAATDRQVLIYDDPTQEYEVQIDDKSITTLGGLVGTNFAVISAASGSGTTLQSISEIDGSSGTSTNNSTTPSPFKGMRFSENVQNSKTDTWTRIIVKMNPKNHVFAGEDLGIV